MNELMNDEAVCRTASPTPGLSITELLLTQVPGGLGETGLHRP